MESFFFNTNDNLLDKKVFAKYIYPKFIICQAKKKAVYVDNFSVVEKLQKKFIKKGFPKKNITIGTQIELSQTIYKAKHFPSIRLSFFSPITVGRQGMAIIPQIHQAQTYKKLKFTPFNMQIVTPILSQFFEAPVFLKLINTKGFNILLQNHLLRFLLNQQKVYGYIGPKLAFFKKTNLIAFIKQELASQTKRLLQLLQKNFFKAVNNNLAVYLRFIKAYNSLCFAKLYYSYNIASNALQSVKTANFFSLQQARNSHSHKNAIPLLANQKRSLNIPIYIPKKRQNLNLFLVQVKTDLAKDDTARAPFREVLATKLTMPVFELGRTEQEFQFFRRKYIARAIRLKNVCFENDIRYLAKWLNNIYKSLKRLLLLKKRGKYRRYKRDRVYIIRELRKFIVQKKHTENLYSSRFLFLTNKLALIYEHL